MVILLWEEAVVISFGSCISLLISFTVTNISYAMRCLLLCFICDKQVIFLFSFVCDSCLLMNNVSLLTRPFEILVQIPHLRPTEYKRSRLPRNRRTVNRAYGGVLSGSAVRERYFTFVIRILFTEFYLTSIRCGQNTNVFFLLLLQQDNSCLSG